MNVEILKSKIHRVTVTEANLNYIGSITIDEALMEAANILPGEHVYIVDNNNGERLETYAIPGEKGSGVVCLNPRYGHQPPLSFAGSAPHGMKANPINPNFPASISRYV